jgi:branched-chain amino acid transport system substrate-binding protein
MTLTRRALVAAAAAAVAPLPRARAEESNTLRIGVLTDMSGPYRDIAGPTSIACLHQAIEDFGAAGKGFNVQVLAADHQNKPHVGADIARNWFDHDGVDVIIDVPTSSVALAVNTIAAEKNKVFINTGSATTDLTGAQCTRNTVHWSYDTAMLATSTGGAVAHAGGDTWFFVTADYVFGRQLQRDTTAVLQKSGGRVLGAVAYPFPATWDFSTYLLQAKASGAKVIGLANAGDDTAACVRQASAFGLAGKVKLAALLGSLNVVHALGLETAQGLLLTESFYWDLNDRTRAWTARVAPKTPDNYPSQIHAGVYAGALHYLKAVAELGTARAKEDGAETVERMKSMPTLDDCFGAAKIRSDGRFMCPAYLFEVKKPAEKTGEWDLYKLLATTPADKAAPPESDCVLSRA